VASNLGHEATRSSHQEAWPLRDGTRVLTTLCEFLAWTITACGRATLATQNIEKMEAGRVQGLSEAAFGSLTSSG